MSHQHCEMFYWQAVCIIVGGAWRLALGAWTVMNPSWSNSRLHTEVPKNKLTIHIEIA